MEGTMTERILSGPVEPYRHRVAEGDCTNCAKSVRLHTPKHGDGSVLVTYWHKDVRDTSRWCRSFVENGIRWVLARETADTLDTQAEGYDADVTP